MNWRSMLRIIAVSLLGLGAAGVTGDAAGQQGANEQLVGAWALVSATNTDAAGKKSEFFGPHPKGVMMLDGHGRFAIMLLRPDLPKFASHNRLAGTPKENQAIVRGSIAYFGTYSVGEADGALSLHVDGSTFPNWTGTDQKRPFVLMGDELRYKNLAPSVGPGTAEVVWKRIK
jgi:lipocalin-like protein